METGEMNCLENGSFTLVAESPDKLKPMAASDLQARRVPWIAQPACSLK